ncbi:Sphingoid long-chain base transporter RSB1 [Colletotrichum higginsianum IMI 349063]|uniref:Sphingoid long-chain base transporter RSB1 n=1 Tax=Colletotrichum higginsianum (strain IMI 349063) TaxID=759273 RepID=A0A1B7YUV1_COLHI|nr:Sphingoid long-chain base transporter RSB1 [Colletotrichum higginsianum IMI 349063]OBR15658.1 Sphingoid long-chain base transporter RSB1 [Colletotrichum higginsianum IMI 349063]
MDPSSPCTPEACDVSESPYGFRPTLVASAVFATVSAACLVVNGAVAARSAHRHTATALFCVVATLACVLELLGWVGRMAGWSDPWAVYPLMQSRALLTIAPGPLATGGGGEGLFVGLEGFLVAYALAVVVGCHPALFLRDGKMVSRIEAEPFVGIDGVGGAVRGAEHERDLEELSKVYQRHHEEEERLSRFERV